MHLTATRTGRSAPLTAHAAPPAQAPSSAPPPYHRATPRAVTVATETTRPCSVRVSARRTGVLLTFPPARKLRGRPTFGSHTIAGTDSERRSRQIGTYHPGTRHEQVRRELARTHLCHVARRYGRVALTASRVALGNATASGSEIEPFRSGTCSPTCHLWPRRTWSVLGIEVRPPARPARNAGSRPTNTGPWTAGLRFDAGTPRTNGGGYGLRRLQFAGG